MDPPLHPVSWEASSGGDGRRGDHAVPHVARRSAQGGGRHPEPGAERATFLYREVLGQEVPWLDGVLHAKRPRRLPVVLTREEVRAVLGQLTGVPRLPALLLYGAGLRVLECARLRVKDIYFTSNQIVVCAGKGFQGPGDDAACRCQGRSCAGTSNLSDGSTSRISNVAPAG